MQCLKIFVELLGVMNRYFLKGNLRLNSLIKVVSWDLYQKVALM